MALELVEIIITHGSTNNFGIYKMNEALSEKYGGEYFLTQGIIREKLLDDQEKCDEIIHRALYTLAGYDDVYKTRLEAHLSGKLVCQKIIIDELKSHIKKLMEYDIPADIDWDLPKECEDDKNDG